MSEKEEGELKRRIRYALTKQRYTIPTVSETNPIPDSMCKMHLMEIDRIEKILDEAAKEFPSLQQEEKVVISKDLITDESCLVVKDAVWAHIISALQKAVNQQIWFEKWFGTGRAVGGP